MDVIPGAEARVLSSRLSRQPADRSICFQNDLKCCRFPHPAAESLPLPSPLPLVPQHLACQENLPCETIENAKHSMQRAKYESNGSERARGTIDVVSPCMGMLSRSILR